MLARSVGIQCSHIQISRAMESNHGEKPTLGEEPTLGDRVCASLEEASRLGKAAVATFHRIRAAIAAEPAPIDDGWEIISDEDFAIDNKGSTSFEQTPKKQTREPVPAPQNNRNVVVCESNSSTSGQNSSASGFRIHVSNIEALYDQCDGDLDPVRKKVLAAKLQRYKKAMASREQMGLGRERVKSTWTTSPTHGSRFSQVKRSTFLGQAAPSEEKIELAAAVARRDTETIDMTYNRPELLANVEPNPYDPYDDAMYSIRFDRGTAEGNKDFCPSKDEENTQDMMDAGKEALEGAEM
ncbi:hypothetical protein B0T24DRAFT_198614 [Lasiosphaeria ovina]|uniref:Uncharacterized protein n=1 Tax=Lasiosphaeria ovina TaxID=92902 RepID=A0AAE0NFQ1_9PEZI|nr:hypothetical protein B0T24DRAFT_198614 [Lasiosphaeria ovina]